MPSYMIHLTIIKSWFSRNNKQLVLILFARPDTNNTSWSTYLQSERTLTTCGAPQGSLLDPLLLLLHINDIYTCSKKLNFYLFADDTNILYVDKNLKSLEHTVNAELHKFLVWLT